MTAEPFRTYPAAMGGAPRRMSRLLWGTIAIVAALAVVAAPPFALGAKVEGRWFPIFSRQAIPAASVVRDDRSLCWTWVRDKNRAPEPVSLAVALDTADGDSFAPEVFNAATGVPWHKGGALPPGRGQRGQFCTLIPVAVARATPVRLRQVLTYRGLMGLWTIQVPLPEVVAD